MQYYGVIRNTNYLEHHGVLGMKWGVRRYQNKDGTRTALGKARQRGTTGKVDKVVAKYAKKAERTNQLDRWGTSEDKNILFVTGDRATGKTTVADSIARSSNPPAEVIHLDAYMGNVPDGKNKAFDKFIRNSVYSNDLPDPREIEKSWNTEYTPHYWAERYYPAMDEFAEAINAFGRSQYGKSKVIVEGNRVFFRATVDATPGGDPATSASTEAPYMQLKYNKNSGKLPEVKYISKGGRSPYEVLWDRKL